MYENIPDELKELTQWCCFKFQQRGDKMSKLPVDANTGEPGKSNDESTWADFDTALEAIYKYQLDGLGFYFKEPYFGIDLDDVGSEIDRYKKDDHDDNIVSEFIEMMCSYAEISPSGNGIHIIAKGDLPKGGRRKGKVEMYDTGRFFTMTNNHLGGYTHIADDSDYGKVNFLHNKYIAKSEVSEKAISKNMGYGSDLTEEDVIRIALKSKNGTRFKMLLDGGWEQFYGSASDADLAFLNDLAFWTNRDAGKMDNIFRRSSLMREKWDRPQNNGTYGSEQLTKAIDECLDVFVPREKTNGYSVTVVEGSTQKVERKYYSYDDTGNAHRFADSFREVVRYSYIRKNWYYYDGKIWLIDQEGKIKTLADRAISKMKNEAIYVPADADEEVIQKAFDKHVKATRSSRGKVSMLKESEHLLPIKPNAFDADPNLFNVQNGYLDLRTGKLHEHDLNKYFTKISTVEYTDKIDCPLWMDFLNTIFDNDQYLINYIQRAIGYSLSGSTEEQMMFILHGNGRNGKSVFLDIITEMFGNYSTNIQPQTIMVKQQSSAANPDIAKLNGARLVTTTEPNEGVRMDEGLVKQLTGGDKVSARFLYEDEFEFTPQFKLWMATNHKPIIRGTDDGIWRRMAIVPFDVQIPIDKVDKQLTNKLKREMKAILNWAVEGYLMWRESGLQEPQSIKDQRKEYRGEMDVLEAFVEECCIREQEAKTKAKDLFNAYRDWAKDNGQYLMSSTKFGKEMGHKFTKLKSSGIYYTGVKLNNEYRPFSQAPSYQVRINN